MTIDIDKATNLIRDLLDPEMYGHAVSAEVRDRARECLGMAAVETARNNRCRLSGMGD